MWISPRKNFFSCVILRKRQHFSETKRIIFSASFRVCVFALLCDKEKGSQTRNEICRKLKHKTIELCAFHSLCWPSENERDKTLLGFKKTLPFRSSKNFETKKRRFFVTPRTLIDYLSKSLQNYTETLQKLYKNCTKTLQKLFKNSAKTL